VIKYLIRLMLLAALPLMLVFALATGCGDDDDNNDDATPGDGDDDDDDDDNNDDDTPLPRIVEFTNGHVTLTVDRARGDFDVAFDGFTYLVNATSAVETGDGGLLFARRTVHPANRNMTAWLAVTAAETAAGTTVELRFPQHENGQVITTLTLLPDGGGLLARMEFISGGVADLVSLIPVYVAPETTGAFFMKSEPAAVQVLQNGSEIVFDFYADLQYADYPYSRGVFNQYLFGRPSSSSDWNALLYDRAAGESLHLGYLSFESVIPEIVIGWDPEQNPVADGHEGWFTLQSRCGFLIARNEPAGSRRTSELFWLDLFTGRPHLALEAYARLLAEALDIQLLHEPVASWDPWYVYGDDIDQEIIEENLQGIEETFGDYGMTSLQVDLGWHDVWGDWGVNPERFPDGLDALAGKIKAAGLIPELWIASFDADKHSAVLQTHPDWRADYQALFRLLMIPGIMPLDLTRPDVLDHVAWSGEQAAAFGFEAVKFDFAYYATMVTAVDNPSLTLVEAYRRALIAFRENFGPEKFFINILLNGINYGLVDSMRISIDSWPCWGDVQREGCPYSTATSGYDGTGLRILLKALARRYYFNNVVWVNHPDQIFFREHLGLIPHRAWGALIALSGGVMSLGEEIASMSDEAVAVYRRLLPNLGVTGVPWDLFDREYPEVWLTPLTDREPVGYVLHLYSWGNNWDRTVNPPIEIAEGARRHAIDLDDLELTGSFHAFEFWTQTDLGVIDDVLEIDVPARDCRVVILRPVKDRPYLVASNRHVSQGGTDLSDPAWEPASAMLSWTQNLVCGFAHTVYIDPAGETRAPSVAVDGDATAAVRAAGSLWAVDLVPGRTGAVRVNLQF